MARSTTTSSALTVVLVLTCCVTAQAQVDGGTVTVGNSGIVRVQDSVNEGQQPTAVGYPGWTVDPPQPTSADWVTISVHDLWWNSCVPDTSEVWQDGNDIYFELDNASLPPCPTCFQVITCCVNLSESVGRLEPETYTVYRIVDPLCPESVPRPVLTFTVRPTCTGDLDCDGVDDAIDVCNDTPPNTAVDIEGRPLGDIDEDCDTDLYDYALWQSAFTGPR